MIFLKNLDIGNTFRVAHPRQVSLNHRRMPTDVVYKIKKVFQMSPHTVIVTNLHDDSIYSLGPDTPVLSQGEPSPSESQVLAFLGRGTKKNKKKVVGYRLLWDGKIALKGIVPENAAALVRFIFALGKEEFDANEISCALRGGFARANKKLSSGADDFGHNKGLLIRKGLLEEILVDAPTPDAIIKANLQEVS